MPGTPSQCDNRNCVQGLPHISRWATLPWSRTTVLYLWYAAYKILCYLLLCLINIHISHMSDIFLKAMHLLILILMSQVLSCPVYSWGNRDTGGLELRKMSDRDAKGRAQANKQRVGLRLRPLGSAVLLTTTLCALSRAWACRTLDRVSRGTWESRRWHPEAVIIFHSRAWSTV